MNPVRTCTIVFLFLLGTLVPPVVLAQKADIAERSAINPGLGPPPSLVVRAAPADAWKSFLLLGRRGDYHLAAHLLDLSEVPQGQHRAVGDDLARKLTRLLDTLGAAPGGVSHSEPEGPTVEGEPSNVVVAFRFRHEAVEGEVWLRRTRDLSTGELAWLFTRQTVSSIPFWYRAVVEGSDVEAAEPLNEGLGEVPASVRRGNPRATVAGFLQHAKAGDFHDASHFLDLGDYPQNEQTAAGRRLARRLMLTVLRTGLIEPDAVSNDEFGVPEAGIPDDEEVLAEAVLARRTVPVSLTRRFDPMLGSVWAFSRPTVAQIDALYRHHGYGWIGDHLPEVFFATQFAGLQLWQWSALVLVLIVGWFAARLLSSWASRVFGAMAARTRVKWDDAMVHALDGPLGLIVWALIVAMASPLVGMSIAAQSLVGRGWRILMLAGFGWMLFRSIDLMTLYVRALATQRSALGLSFIPIAGRVSKILILVFVFLAVLDVIGVEVVGLLAGLGLGGLAIAFAAQKTIENLFGAIAIAGDRPFKVGDWVTTGDVSGTVEDVGLRSTRIRPMNRTLVSIPNGVLMGQTITNFGERDRIMFETTIGVVYETTADQIVFILDEIKKMLLADPRVYPDSHRVRFKGFGPSSLDILIICWILTTNFHEFTGIAEEINLNIMRIVERSGSSFAFPTQTIHMARDEMPNQDLRESIRNEVEGRRQRGDLTVPEPTDDMRRQLRGGVNT
ncbi:mechanosensitive ion channel family protein [Candidatus Fermentibacteria bacterium]|nr:mechanosensitive ion channel family protein [Candidatus Fermentibacteria bacterium]